MPEIKLQHVVSCSSEDKNNPAENLLKSDGTHKWKSATSGLKQGTVVLQFEKSSQIQSIDIGNDGAAFVEILVGKSTASTDQEYQVILMASTFMTPIESRNGNNRNAVRMFGVDKLSKAVAGQKWDRVKIVCTQPFNKNTPYGLSFIRFHSPSDGTEETQKPIKKLGAFTIKSEDGDNIKAGSLFADRTKDKPTESTPLKGAAAIRAVSKLVEETRSPSTIERKTASTPSPSASVSTSSSSSSSSSKPSPSTVKRKHSGSDDEEKRPQIKAPLRKQSTSLSSVSSNKSHEDKAPPLKKIKSEPVKQSPIKEFSKLMEKVIFAMSGYQNPYRGELRDKALEMGGTYKPDWGRGCTHLICAFPNTPKYNQVKDTKGNNT
ncbi:DNA repair protein XRCC1 [Patella vulgata]|uniref:DNA repair protein XRCC1 n=1 Tax=Patella vulgata TaxID=6465 RepID=UPI00217F9711|nr:DNA repair protein XRCC1 [Patella vulgata]